MFRLHIQKVSKFFRLVWSIVFLGEIMSTDQLDYVALIINYLRKRRLWGGYVGHMWVSIFEA